MSWAVCAGLVLTLVAWAAPVIPAAGAAVPTPQNDPFYSYRGSTPLASIAPGTVLGTRTVSYHVLGILLPVKVVQLLYRSTGMLGQATVNVTSVLEPPLQSGTPKVISYQSFYDSLNPDDEPSYQISGGVTLGGLIPDVESVLIAPALLAGYTVVVPDTEGEPADFAAGPVYGYNTLDSLRAALSSSSTHLTGTRQVGMLGYSGGAIATEWASELAPTYAPSVNKLLVGATYGGVLVDPAHNLQYVSGSSLWAGVMPMALIGIARASNVDLTPYLSAYGQQLFGQFQKRVDHPGAVRWLRGSHLRPARPAAVPEPGEHPHLRQAREPAHHGHRRHPDHPAADRPGRRRHDRRDGRATSPASARATA